MMRAAVAAELGKGGDVLPAQHPLVHQRGAEPHSTVVNASHASVTSFGWRELAGHEPVAAIQFAERAQGPVPALPSAAGEILLEPDQARLELGRGELREAGDVRPESRIEVRLWTPPEGGQESIGAVARNGDGRGLDESERSEGLQWRKPLTVASPDRREVVPGQPPAGEGRVAGQEHGTPSGDAPDLGERTLPVAPVVDGEDGQRRLDAPDSERDRFGGGLERGSRPRCALPDHRPGGLDGDDETVHGLVCTGPGAD